MNLWHETLSIFPPSFFFDEMGKLFWPRKSDQHCSFFIAMKMRVEQLSDPFFPTVWSKLSNKVGDELEKSALK